MGRGLPCVIIAVWIDVFAYQLDYALFGKAERIATEAARIREARVPCAICACMRDAMHANTRHARQRIGLGTSLVRLWMATGKGYARTR